MAFDYQSWGRFPSASHAVRELEWITDKIFPLEKHGSCRHEYVLPYGQGRSYGDSCLNDGGTLLATKRLDRIISFDAQTGLLKAESGMTLEQVLMFAVPRGWFLPVTPGTRFVSLGGAVANDIHGKNHHRAGTFGCHVTRFLLLRSDGSQSICSAARNKELFRATVGGLGLTGLILWVELRLRKIETSYIKMDSIKFHSLDEFFEISGSSDESFEHTVAWLDCVAAGSSFGRGIFMRGNHAQPEELAPSLKGKAAPRNFKLHHAFTAPCDAPGWALNNLTVRAFNALYFGKQRVREVTRCVPLDPFFYPLDAVGEWNRIYGKRGFMQFQCAVPSSGGNAAIRELLKVVVQSGRASFLAVMKEFGSVSSPGLLSFPRAGVTLCLDIPNQGRPTIELLTRLDKMVCEFAGAMYPAKDACMSAGSFQQYYPAWAEFSKFIDPKFSSSFWRRVTGVK